MTNLSVNINKIALLRNSRGRDFPNVVDFAKQFLALGVHGITVHPRQDERHITRQDAYDLAELFATTKTSGTNAKQMQSAELNIEGYPSEDFMLLVEETKPAQCTLVPDAPGQLTSDHGWDVIKHHSLLKDHCQRLNEQGIRTALFLDPDLAQLEQVPLTQSNRIELYTESYAASYGKPNEQSVLEAFRIVAKRADELNIELNAGHDLALNNLQKFLTIPNILEVSIGHELTIESIQFGMKDVIAQYLAICKGSA